ncbi:GMC family oxidoreductase [Allopontixanthobacter sp.]|uniref:GMC family oxidoreductase n=1 Tax=Allopontixanthobacter sp. TaxID=2906452 RepID=UPI002ABC68C2|nr:GMC family oxidoreductase [Allopontixanthobacter sp.]MDZ4307706.1 GMC family oxidoreductase [Allopontixanthobacter sp.]
MGEATGTAEGLRIRAADGRAPDVFRPGGWVPMRCFRDSDEVDFAIVGTGCGGGVLAAKLAAAGFSVVAFDAGAWWRPLEDFASDEREQRKLYWNDERITGGDDPIELGGNNSGKSVGGSTVHFQMVALRFRPEWFKSRSLLGYGHDWPVDWREMWRYYDEVENALKIAGPVNYPWGPPRRRYPYRPHEMNAAGRVLARGAEKLGVAWASTPLATLSAPRGDAPPCVYRGFCKTGCSTNAKQSVLVTWIPAAVAAGAEVRDLAMVGRVEMGKDGRATGVLYHRGGEWRQQKARHVVVAGYSIETPRLLLNSACPAFPDGLANSSGLVGKSLMVHSNDAVWGEMAEEIRWYKGPPSMAVCEHWNYQDAKNFAGGYAFMSQGPLPIDHAQTLVTGRGLWGMKLRQEMTRYNHMAGLKIVGEVEPRDANRVEVTEELDPLGLPIPRVTFAYSDNDRKLIDHSVGFMTQVMEAAGARKIFATASTAHLMGGCRMGNDPTSSVTNPYGRTWDIPNLWICDGSLMPTGGGVNPSMTIMANAARIGDHIREIAGRGEL